jgi:hypothetical protein
MNRQERRIEITLHRSNPTRTLMPTQRERFLDVVATAMAVLGQFGRASGDFLQDAASSCNRAFQPFDKHPWCMSPHILAILFLPRFVGQLFRDDGISRSDNLMNETPMQTLAMGRQFALVSSQTPASCLVALALTPKLFALLDPSTCLVVLWIIRPSLSIQLPLETASQSLIRFEFRAEGEQTGFSLLSYNGKGRGTKIKTDGDCPYLILGFLVGNAFQSQLSIIAIAFTICPLCLWRAGPTTQQTDILDAMAQAMLDNRIVPSWLDQDRRD